MESCGWVSGSSIINSKQDMHMQHPSHQPPANIIRANPSHLGPLDLQPGASQRIPLGRYREADSAPEFHIQYQPDIPNIVTHEMIKLPLGDGQNYVLTCQLQSFADQPVTVTITCRNA
jgi:hypothetical protein